MYLTPNWGPRPVKPFDPWKPKEWKPEKLVEEIMDDFTDTFKNVMRINGYDDAPRFIRVKDEYIWEIDAPGVSPDKIAVEVVQSNVAVQYTRKKSLHPFSTDTGIRALVASIPADAKQSELTASYEHGVLTIKIPVEKPPEAKKIPIKIQVT